MGVFLSYYILSLRNRAHGLGPGWIDTRLQLQVDMARGLQAQGPGQPGASPASLRHNSTQRCIRYGNDTDPVAVIQYPASQVDMDGNSLAYIITTVKVDGKALQSG